MALALFEQIASQVGVSARTVQRVLNSELKDTRPSIIRRSNQIRVLAEQMNYRPNSAAQAVARGSFKCISLVRAAGGGKRFPFTSLSDGILQELVAHDMHLSLHQLPDEKLTQAGYLPKVLRTSMSDGLLVDYAHDIPSKMIELIRQDAMPTIWLNVKMPSDCVHPDDRQASQLAARHLIDQGHRRIAFVEFGVSGHYSESDRNAGYTAAMRAAGLQPQYAVYSGDNAELGTRNARLSMAREFLTRPDRPTAVVAYSSATAQPLAVAAMAMGLKIPQDLSIVSVDVDFAASMDLGFSITTVLVDAVEFGRQGVRALLKKIENPDRPLKPLLIPGKLVAGQTTV
jgi:LacI family transcriptional regulator